MYIYMVFFSVGLVVFFYIFFYILSFKSDIDSETMSCYECGFGIKTSARMIFSYRFFLIAILFLIFDVEISLMLPLPFVGVDLVGIMGFLGFVLVLILGLMYEYYLGGLNWL